MAAGEDETFDEMHEVPDNAPDYLADAMQDIGLQEYVIRNGKKVSNPIVERFSEKATGKKYDAIKYPWCAFWVGAKLEYNGITCSKSGMARSYTRWGDKVLRDDAQPGDIVIIWRGSRDDGITGHVFFFLEWGADGKSVKGIGGNQGDAVSIASFPSYKILDIRRPRGMMQSKTIKSSLGSAGSEAMSKLVDVGLPDHDKLDTTMSFLEQLQSPLQALSHIKPQLKMALEFIAIALALYAAYCRFNDHKSGKNA